MNRWPLPCLIRIALVGRPTFQKSSPWHVGSRRLPLRPRRRRGRACLAAMTWIDSVETFCAEAEKLYVEHPDHTRFVSKYRHCDGKLELKVTNDRVCLKFATDQQQDLKRIDKLNNLFITYMCGKDPYADTADDLAEGSVKPASGGDAGAADRPASGAGKKKKAKK